MASNFGESSPKRKWIEPVVAVLMAMTTLCTVWCSYHSAAWTRRSDRRLNEYNQTISMSANLQRHDNRLLVLRVGGELKKSELNAVQSEFVKKIAGPGTVRLLVLLENFTGWERGEQWGDTDFFFSHRNDFEKIAVVGNPRWEAQVMAFTGAGLRKGGGEVFSRNRRVRGA